MLNIPAFAPLSLNRRFFSLLRFTSFAYHVPSFLEVHRAFETYHPLLTVFAPVRGCSDHRPDCLFSVSDFPFGIFQGNLPLVLASRAPRYYSALFWFAFGSHARPYPRLATLFSRCTGAHMTLPSGIHMTFILS